MLMKPSPWRNGPFGRGLPLLSRRTIETCAGAVFTKKSAGRFGMLGSKTWSWYANGAPEFTDVGALVNFSFGTTVLPSNVKLSGPLTVNWFVLTLMGFPVASKPFAFSV